MTDEQINAAIAEACGWTNVTAAHRSGKAPGADYVGYEFYPNYCGDLNAMHEAERIIADKGVNAWWIYCGNIVRLMPSIFGNETAVMATARQRAEAFLRTLGKWEGAE